MILKLYYFYCSILLKYLSDVIDIPEENLAKSESSMLPESKMNFDYAIDYRKY